MTIPMMALGLLLALCVPAQGAEPTIMTLSLPTGQTVVVAEGAREARSLGSVSVRVYAAAPPGEATTFFLSGLIRPRDGVLEAPRLADLDGDQRLEIIVVARSVGTGGYLSAQAFALVGERLVERGAVAGLAPQADPVAALRRALAEGE